MSDYHQILNVEPGASLEVIQAAYTRERGLWKDSAVEGDENAIAQLEALDKAYKALVAQGQPVDGTAVQASEQTVAPDKETSALATRNADGLALQASSEPVAHRECPHCGVSNPVQATLCVACGVQITRPCPNCGQPVGLEKKVCARCQAIIPEYAQRGYAQAAAVEQQIQQERREAAAKHQVLVEAQRVMARQGAIFWLFVTVACSILTVLAFVLYSLGQ